MVVEVDYERVMGWARRIWSILREVFDKYEQLDKKAWRIDAELIEIYVPLLRLYRSFKQALEEDKIDKARELLARANRRAEKLKELIDKARSFNADVENMWDRIKSTAISDIVKIEDEMPTELRLKMDDTYIRPLYDLVPPLSVFGKYYDVFLSNVEFQISEMKEKLKVAEERSKRLSL
jgi:transposase-like protein